MNSVDSKTINTFDAMTKYKTISHYDKVLNHRFQGLSLKSFVKAFKNQKPFIKPKFLEEFNKKYPLDNEELSKDDKEIKKRNFMNLLNKKKVKKNITIDAWSKSIRELKVYEQGPDPLRYTPNYQSIFKNSPKHKFSPLRNSKNDIKKLLELNQKNKTIEKTAYNNLFIKTLSNENNIIPTKTLPSISTISLTNTLNNHAFKFMNYMSRKSKTSEQSKIISYVEPHNYKTDANKRIVIDFRKMVDRTKSMLINYHSLGVPPSSYYNPKYDYIDKKSKQYLFTHQKIIDENKKSNKFLIHKLWTSFNVPRQYQLIDNDKLKKDISLDFS